MSDYVDTVDIEGVQYSIQDTLTKLQLGELEAGQVYSTTKVDTGMKWTNGQTIYRKVLIFQSPAQGNANFPSNTASETYPIGETCNGFVDAYGVVVHEGGVRLPIGMALTSSQWAVMWLRTNAHPQNPNTIGFAVGTACVNLAVAVTILFV